MHYGLLVAAVAVFVGSLISGQWALAIFALAFATSLVYITRQRRSREL